MAAGEGGSIDTPNDSELTELGGNRQSKQRLCLRDGSLLGESHPINGFCFPRYEGLMIHFEVDESLR